MTPLRQVVGPVQQTLRIAGNTVEQITPLVDCDILAVRTPG